MKSRERRDGRVYIREGEDEEEEEKEKERVTEEKEENAGVGQVTAGVGCSLRMASLTAPIPRPIRGPTSRAARGTALG
jgi:hypothetical protein